MALHGSWNRQPASGYKVVRIRFQSGQPVTTEDFLTGYDAKSDVVAIPLTASNRVEFFKIEN